MAAPSLVKTWQYSLNNRSLGIGVEHDRARQLLLLIKDILIGFTSNPWTVDYSCTGVVAGTVGDGVDRWSVYTDLLWGTGAHSWIVLNLPGGQQLLLDQDYTTATCESMVTRVSPGGLFTGGTTTTRPTATDETEVCYNTSDALSVFWCGGIAYGGGINTDAVVHVWHSTDGTLTRLLVYYNDICVTMWEFGFMADKRAAQTSSFYAAMMQGTTTISVLSSSAVLDNTWRVTWSAVGAETRCTLLTLGFGSITWSESSAAHVPEEFDDEYQLVPFVVWSNVVGARGFKGSLVDIWSSQYQALRIGDNSPAGSSRNFVHLEGITLPWSGDNTMLETR